MTDLDSKLRALHDNGCTIPHTDFEKYGCGVLDAIRAAADLALLAVEEHGRKWCADLVSDGEDDWASTVKPFVGSIAALRTRGGSTV